MPFTYTEKQINSALRKVLGKNSEDIKTIIDELKAIKSEPKKKRARNSYMIFCSEKKDKVKDKKQMMKELGAMWKALSAKEKTKYEQKAKKEKELTLQGRTWQRAIRKT